jgi:hypothetical protein
VQPVIQKIEIRPSTFASSAGDQERNHDGGNDAGGSPQCERSDLADHFCLPSPGSQTEYLIVQLVRQSQPVLTPQLGFSRASTGPTGVRQMARRMR